MCVCCSLLSQVAFLWEVQTPSMPCLKPMSTLQLLLYQLKVAALCYGSCRVAHALVGLTHSSIDAKAGNIFCDLLHGAAVS